MAFELPALPYAYDALQPYIDKETMIIHHTGHHQAYIDNLNAALENFEELKQMNIEDIIKNLDSMPPSIYTTLRNNGGGHYNHSIFWKIMAVTGTTTPHGKLLNKINQTFGSVDIFKQLFKRAALSVFGSGWAWLAKDKEGNLYIAATPNQDNPLTYGYTPVFGIDVWEHAYYLKYQNKRADYIDAWWNVLNWDQAEKNYVQCKPYI
mgnify:CR=1 FL=1